MQKLPSVAFHTLGCKLNFSETSALARHLEQEGFVQKNFEEEADYYVINTCSVTDNADKECRQLVRRIQRRSPASAVVITGCYAQLKPNEIASIPGVDLVLGAAAKFELASHLQALKKGDETKICSCDIDSVENFHASWSVQHRTRTFLKVQDGCDYNCSFCTIPMARGKSRSDKIANVLTNVKEIEAAGSKEIILTGVNLGDFGENGETFLQLISALDNETSIPRYRISSIEPNLLSDDIIKLVASSQRFMPHFHIPLQSGSDRILGLMRRRYKRKLYAERVALIKELMPHASIGVDVIVGFPGETDTDFQETYSFLESLPITYLHVFTYSERDNTLADTLNEIVPVPVRQARNKKLRQLSYQKQAQFANQFSGTTRPVLFEKEEKTSMMEGYSDNYIRIKTPFRKEWVNEIIDWKV
ncbi:MAG: tRNA (N(6)-L-threonylcarbamoyladenosine(37)-C(2))-methylthiotransferase MtaB [Bacteroidetes bacterium]|nr:tRNA (N(6)-L-threonylcarbamoyladenosine(37)-C(2))-methylthiotransferase MtaB [Bacteroidota bacterium]